MADKFRDFNIVTSSYKTVNEHPIQVNILVPKSLTTAKPPVIVRFHGGGYVTGDSLFPEWFPEWQVELALRHAAIVVSPNYRLLPEANGLDIMQDVQDLWQWLNSSLVETVQASFPQIAPDLSRIMTAGESAGGYLSVQLSLNHPQHINSCIAEFPSLDLQSADFRDAKPNPEVPKDVIQHHLANMEEGAVISSDISLSRFPLILSMTENGLFLPIFGSDPVLFPFERIRRGAKLPPTFIIHGIDDVVVPARGSQAFVELLQQEQPHTKVVFSLVPGPHGLGNEWHMDHPALRAGLEFAIAAWLGSE